MARGQHGEDCLKTLYCEEYEPGLANPRPAIRVHLYTLAGEEVGEVRLTVDTGYEGSILLPTQLYERFKIAELPASMWRRYMTLTGVVTMRVARAIAEVRGKRMEVFVETPLYGGWRGLAGREFLNKLRLLLDGPAAKLCILE